MGFNLLFAVFFSFSLVAKRANADSLMTEDVFNQAIDEVVDFFRPIALSHGGLLTVQKKWNVPKPNATTGQLNGLWSIIIYGGLGKEPSITKDALQLAVCHEVGHHLGGFPFADYADWSSSEGQADIYAVQVCLPQIWSKQKEANVQARFSVDPFAQKMCDKAWLDPERRYLCYRIAVASFNMAIFLSDGNEFPLPGNPPLSFATPDPTQVETTDGYGLVSGQCRLDTLFQASLCDAQFDLFKIPGLGFPNGARGLDAEEDAAASSCTAKSRHTMGLRPRCWFKPRL